MQNKNKNRAEKIQYYFDTKEYRLCPYGLKKHIRRSKLSSGAKECFHLLLDEATFSDDWSVQISREDIAEEIIKHPNTVTKLLTELEKNGYIIREQLPSKASNIYINLPQEAIEDLESSPNRKRTKAIKKCGTIDQVAGNNVGSIKIKPTQKIEVDLRKNEYLTIYNNKLYNNNIDRDLSSGEKQQNLNLVVNSNAHNEKSLSTMLITAKQDNESDPNEISKSSNITEIDNSEILKNKHRIKSIETEIAPLLKQSQDIIKLKDEIGCVKMLNKLNEFNKTNKNLFEKELEISKLRYFNEKIILSSLQAKFNSGLINNSDLKNQKIKTLKVKSQMLRNQSTNMMEKYNSTRNTKYLDEKHRFESEEYTARLEIQKLLDEDKPVEINKHNDYLHGKGNREFSDDLINWIKNQISLILKTTNKKVILKTANEIAYQVRFGNLQVSYQTKQVMTVKHGINIALKKLRLGEWSRPSGMPKDEFKRNYVTHRKEQIVNENPCQIPYQNRNSNVGITSLAKSTALLVQKLHQGKLNRHSG